jgi:hypothetical protein
VLSQNPASNDAEKKDAVTERLRSRLRGQLPGLLPDSPNPAKRMGGPFLSHGEGIPQASANLIFTTPKIAGHSIFLSIPRNSSSEKPI